MTSASRVVLVGTLVALIHLGFPSAGRADSLKNIKIRGYVTVVTSPTTFEIEDYRITHEQGFVLDLENASSDLQFKPEDIRVGVELEIQGVLNEDTGELRAKSIKVDLEQFRPLRQTAIIAATPQGIARTAAGWTGRLFADGQRIVITEKTQVVFRPTNREKKQIKQARKTADADDEEEPFEQLSSLDQVTVGMAMTYEGRRNPEDGTVIAERVEFSRNDLEDGEAKLWKSLKTTVKPAQGLKPGELKINRVGKFKLLPDAAVQEYIQGLGASLIPGQQRTLAADDPRKIPFQFFVVIDKGANAFALANGTVVINSGLIDLMENEAQLTAVMGHEIAHATQEHTWRQTQFHKKKRFALSIAGAVAAGYGLNDVSDLLSAIEGAIRNGHSRSLENQADRVGLDYMASAGYDPRQAPQVWKLMTKKYGLQATNVFWSTHENQATRRSYLMNELKNNYRDLDYSTLKTNEEQFKEMQEKVRLAAQGKKRIRVS